MDLFGEISTAVHACDAVAGAMHDERGASDRGENVPDVGRIGDAHQCLHSSRADGEPLESSPRPPEAVIAREPGSEVIRAEARAPGLFDTLEEILGSLRG